MTVYVDDMLMQASVPNGRVTHHSRWSHLMADSIEELVAFAKSIGLKESWLQMKSSGVHFDVTEPKRFKAIQRGAVEVPLRTEEWKRVVAQARQQYRDHRAQQSTEIDLIE